MQSERKYAVLTDRTFVDVYSSKEQTEEFKKQVREYLCLLKDIIKCDFSKLNDKEFYAMLCRFYSIDLEERDYLEMLSKHNNKRYINLYKIPTTMTFKNIKAEGYRKGFDWWEQIYQVYYTVMASEHFIFDYEKVYSKEDIKKLLFTKDIVILKEYTEELDDSIPFAKQKYEEMYSLDIDLENDGDNMSKFVLENFDLFGNLLRKKFTKKVVLKDIRKFLIEFNDEIQEIFSVLNDKDSRHYETALMCYQWYNLSKEKEDFQNMKRSLIVSHKN